MTPSPVYIQPRSTEINQNRPPALGNQPSQPYNMPILAESDSGSSSPLTYDPNSIAVVGLACRFPEEASTAENFWDFILKGKCW